MNDGTYEGILNQDDVQEYFNGDDARPFYPEHAETVLIHTSRARTHYDGCHRVHPECALVKVAELEKERDELKNILRTGENLGWSAAYRGALSRAERLEAERDAANERAAQFEADAREAVSLMETVGHLQDGQILEPSDQITARNLIAKYLDNSEWATMVNEASELYQRIDDLEKELAKANERADTNHESFVKIFAASRSKDAIIAGLNQKVVSVNERAEQAEADARALAQRVFETEILTDSEIEIVARYVPREQMEGAGYK